MKTKLVLWGNNASDERVLIAMQLRADDNKVDIWTFPEAIASPEFAQKMLNEWRNDAAEVVFPDGAAHVERELTVAESLLPDDLKVERTDIVQRAQTEWHFIVLSTKLHENYKSELADLQDKVGQLTEYSGEVWESLKGFWNKVQEQVRDRNLFREHADVLRDNTNVLFEELKQKRSTLTNEFESNSKSLFERFNSVLDEIEKKVEQGIQRFPDIFEDLKKTQSNFRDQKLMRDHSNEIWQRIDNMFKVVKEKKFGNNAINDTSATERLTRRYEGLIGAIDKMQDSIDRDKEELNFQTKRVAATQGQLEAQIRQAKINMIQERIKSKEEKLNEMLATKNDVENKMTNVKEKEAKKEAAAGVGETKTEAVAPVAPIIEVVEAKQEEVPPVAEVEPAIVETPKIETPKEEAPKVLATTPNVDTELANVAADVDAALEAVDKV
jgi:hypothetical protein